MVASAVWHTYVRPLVSQSSPCQGGPGNRRWSDIGADGTKSLSCTGCHTARCTCSGFRWITKSPPPASSVFGAAKTSPSASQICSSGSPISRLM